MKTFIPIIDESGEFFKAKYCEEGEKNIYIVDWNNPICGFFVEGRKNALKEYFKIILKLLGYKPKSKKS